jgi:hypothetical protein
MPNKNGIAIATATGCSLQLARTLQALLCAAAAHVILSAQGETDYAITTTAAAMCNCLTVVCALKCAAQCSALLLDTVVLLLYCSVQRACMYAALLKTQTGDLHRSPSSEGLAAVCITSQQQHSSNMRKNICVCKQQ